MARKSDGIRKITLKDKSVRYRFVIDVPGSTPLVNKATGAPVLDRNGHQKMKRDQRCYTFTTETEAIVERAKVIADRSRGTFVKPTKKLLREQLDEWLAGKRKIRESTRSNYRNALKPAYEQLGQIALQDLTKSHVDRLITGMLDSGRRVGTKGRPLANATVTLTLTCLRMALADALTQGIVVRNVAMLVERPGVGSAEMQTWTAERAGAFLTYVASERLAVAWQLSMYGMRRGEVLGLRWDDVDLAAKTLTIRRTRVIVEGRVVESEPKTERGKRTLPLSDDLVTSLTSLQLVQRDERDRADDAYGACPDCKGEHVVVDELGDPIHPESYSDRFEVLVRKAKLPKIRLHDTRHTCGTLMHLRGVPVAVISAWLGHASARFTMGVYVHSQADALREAGATITEAYAPAARSTTA